MPEQSSVGALIDAVGDQRTAEEPFYITASRVFNDGIGDLGDEQLIALETVGFESVRRDGAPSVVPVPSVVRMIENGRSYDHDAIPQRERPKLMLLGFLALAAEALLHGGDE